MKKPKTKRMANRIFRELKIKVEKKICKTCNLSFMYSESPSIVVSWLGSTDELINASEWKITEMENHSHFLCDKFYRIEKLNYC